MTAVLPSKYHITKCQTMPGGTWCGCYTAVKDISRIPICKIHGKHADQGAQEVLGKLRVAGYGGPVLTQFPVFSEGNQNVSRNHASMDRSDEGIRRKGGKGKGKGGEYHSGLLKVDILLCSMSSTHLAAVEVQGENHADTRVKTRDGTKKRAADFLPDCRLFEMSSKKPKVDIPAEGVPSNSSASSMRPKRAKMPPTWLRNTLSPQSSKACEAVAFLR